MQGFIYQLGFRVLNVGGTVLSLDEVHELRYHHLVAAKLFEETGTASPLVKGFASGENYRPLSMLLELTQRNFSARCRRDLPVGDMRAALFLLVLALGFKLDRIF